MRLGYARVSKAEEQDPPAQVAALRAAGCERIYEGRASRGRWDRPELHRLLDHLREGDVLVVWKLDRLSRSLKDLLHLMERVHEAGAGFRSLTEAVDTTTPAGRMLMQMVGAFAEFEREMIRERTGRGSPGRGRKVGWAAAGRSSRPARRRRSGPTASPTGACAAGPRSTARMSSDTRRVPMSAVFEALGRTPR